MRHLRIALLAVTAILAGCSDDPTAPTAPTKDFSGTLPLRSSVWHTVSTVAPGTLKVTLTNLSAGPVRLVIGDAGNACKAIASNGAATAGTVIGASVGAATYCVTIADIGQLTAAATYTLRVTYP